MASFRPSEADLIVWAEAAGQAAEQHGDLCVHCQRLGEISDYLTLLADAGAKLPAVDLD